MKTARNIIVAILLSVVCITSAKAQEAYGEIRGIIKNDMGEFVPFATIKVTQDKVLVGGTESNSEGNYKIKPLLPGSYEVIVLEDGHQTKKINGVKVIPSEATYFNIKLAVNTVGTVEVTAEAIVEDYSQAGCNTTMYSMTSINSAELLKNSGFEAGNLMTVIPTMVSDVVVGNNGELHFRGSRGNVNGYYVDGVRVSDISGIPGLMVENLTVFSGGVPANYGDVTAGVVLVTTKSYFSGLREKNILRNQLKEKREAKEAARKEEMAKKAGIIFY